MWESKVHSALSTVYRAGHFEIKIANKKKEKIKIIQFGTGSYSRNCRNEGYEVRRSNFFSLFDYGIGLETSETNEENGQEKRAVYCCKFRKIRKRNETLPFR